MIASQHLLDNGLIERLVKRLKHLDSPNLDIVQKLSLEAEYFERNAHRIATPDFRKRGLFVGSGVVEASCKTAIASRLQYSGMFWTVAGQHRPSLLPPSTAASKTLGEWLVPPSTRKHHMTPLDADIGRVPTHTKFGRYVVMKPRRIIVVSISSIIRKVKLGETPIYRLMRSVFKTVFRPTAPRIPMVLKPLLRVMYELHFTVISAARMCLTVFYRHPLFQARCESVGKHLSIDGLPFVSGHVEIHIGNDVWLGGNLYIACGRSLERPILIIGDRSEIGWNVELIASREIIIEEDVRIATRCRVSDTDGHPREADLRAQNSAVNPRDIRAVRICRNAWIGHSAHIMKGVTIGEGAIIAANSVVIMDVPPYCLAMGNPAEVYFRNFGRPSKPHPPPVPAD